MGQTMANAIEDADRSEAQRCRIKICCMQSREEIALAARAGADAVGFVMQMPSGAGILGAAAASAIVGSVPPGVSRWMLSSAATPALVHEELRLAPVETVQLVDHVDPAFRRELRRLVPGLRIVQVVHVNASEARSLAIARAAAESSDALLLDSGDPTLAVKALGGTGRCHNWRISRAIVEAVAPLSVWLAGGLHAGNVITAIETVRPFGVDVCTGVRDASGRLDAARLSAFIDAVEG